MDPTNNTTPNPAPNPAPTPVPDAATAPSDPLSAAGFDGATSVADATVQPPAGGDAPVPPTPTAPVNPVIQPSGAPATPPVNPVIRPSGLGVTEPIMMPEKPAEPDPVEEELKAPMKAAGPVPGSIGSAVSGPSGEATNNDAGANTTPPVSDNNPFADTGKPTPSVSFNDPAGQPTPNDANMVNSVNQAQPAKKKTNKTTLIALIAVAAIIVIVLIVVLIMQLNSGGGSQGNASSGGGSNVAYEPNENDGKENEDLEDDSDVDDNVGVAVLVCSGELKTEAGQTLLQKVSFMADDSNKIDEIKISSKISDVDGNELQSSESTVDFNAISKEAIIKDDVTDKYVGADGSLLVSPAEFASAMQDALNSADSENTVAYSCIGG